MGDYNIDINVNMGGSSGNFQSLIDSVNALNANFQKVGESATNAGNKSKQSFSDSMSVIKRYGGTVESAAAAINKWKAKINELNSNLNKQLITQKQYNAQLNTAHAAIKRIETAQKQYNSTLAQTNSKTKTASAGIKNLTNVFNKLGAVLGVSFGLYGAFRGLKGVVKTISEFELAQKKLRSILGETESGMELLSKSAISIGKNSIFGAKGVTELQIELAKMGFVKGDIIKMTKAINDLATATQEDLGKSTEVVANVIRAFQLDSSKTTMVVDVMAKAFNTSALSLDNFRESIKYVAPVAAQAGFSFEQTTAALALLANVGLKGSLAGTGLNNVLKSMMDSNSKLSKSLGGTVEGYDGFISVLKKAKDEAWTSEKIFGVITQRATAAFSTMVNNVEKIDEFKENLQSAIGTAERQAAIQMESITYKSKILGNTFKALVLEIDKGNGLISNTLKLFIDGFISVLSPVKSISDAFLEQRKNVYDLKESISPLIDEYDKITDKAVELGNKNLLLTDEQERLEEIIRKIGDAIPRSVTELNKYGAAMSINSTIARQYIKDQERILYLKQEPAILEAEKRLKIATEKRITAEKEYNRIKKDSTVTDVIKTLSGWSEKQLQTRQATNKEIKKAEYLYLDLLDKENDELLLLEDINGEFIKRERLLREEEARKKSIIDESYEEAKKRLEYEKAYQIESIKLKYKGDEEKRKISEATAYFDNQLALFIKDPVESQRAVNLAKIKNLNELKDISEKISLDSLKTEQKIQQTKIKGLYDGYEEEKKLLDSNYEYGLKILEKETEGNSNRDKKILEYKEKYIEESINLERKHRIEILNVQKDLSQLQIQIEFEGYEETVKLREDSLKRELEILNERDLETEKHNAEYEKIMAKYHLEIAKETKKFQDELTKLTYEGEVTRLKISGDSFNNRRSEIDLWYDYELSLLDKSAPNYLTALSNLGDQRRLKLKELEDGKSIWEMLFPKADSKEIAAMQESMSIITNSINQVVDSWVNMTDKVVDELNRQVSEIQSALEIEAELMAAGYANNVTLKRKELEETKKARDKALEDQRKAQKTQLIINSTLQASELALTVVQLLKSGVKMAGIPGLLIGGAAAATLFAIFKSFQNLAKQQSATKFEKGGWIGGRRHSEGGTIIEGEKGEFVVNRRSSSKHNKLIEAINKDDTYELNKIYLNNLKGQIVNARVSLDDSKYLKGIYDRLGKDGKSIEYSSGYRIERVGNVTTKIRLN